MLRQDASAMSSDRNGAIVNAGTSSGNLVHREPSRVGGVDIQRELNKLEEMLLDSPRVFLTRRTLIDEEQFLDQLDLIRLNLPTAFQEATEVVLQKEEILLEAEQYAQEIIETAERRAAQILDEMNLMRQAELEIQQIRQRVQQECEEVREQTLEDIDRMRRHAQQESEEIRQMAIAECEDIQSGADAYADRVLQNMEHQLSEMLRIIRNGRQQLSPEPEPSKARDSKDALGDRQAAMARGPERPKKS
ncbi:MAG TPA: DivIVA domain-containing protein [Chroococcidiopsis sp.]